MEVEIRAEVLDGVVRHVVVGGALPTKDADLYTRGRLGIGEWTTTPNSIYRLPKYTKT